MKQRIVVIGSTGTVGRRVRTQLLRAGVEVRAVSREPGGDGVRADLRAPESLRVAAEGAEAVFLVWPFASAEGLPEVLAVLGEQARRVVYLSSAAVREHEREAERLIRESGLEWTILRPHSFAANTLRWAEQIRAGQVIREPYGAAAMSLVHEEDIAAVAVAALTRDEHAGSVYELTGPQSLTQAEQARIIGEVIGRPVRWEERDPREARERMLGLGWPADAVEDVLRAQEAMTAAPAPITATVTDVTGTAARSFRSWVAEHAHAFVSFARAARIHEYGGPGNIGVEAAALPVPGPGEVLIKVAATAFNPSETALRSGALQQVLPLALPYTLGWDVSGTVVATGAGARRWAPGEHVIGRLDRGGAAAEYVTAPQSVLAAAPAAIPLADAAAIPVAALTAWQAVYEHAQVRHGRRVLINGAGGGVGGFAVQLAKRAGATVIATAGARSAAAVRAAGADEVVDYTSEPLPGGVDAVINLVVLGPDAAAGLLALVRPGGAAVSIATPLPAESAVHFVTRNDAGQLAQIVALVDAGELTVDVAERLPLEELAAVHGRSEAGRTRGKIILIP
ncbi:zinc-binding dehydrogenase [Nonomuraea insulae]|uniref:Zinc-binding dehydrogenase n=1 Tax=Nonomuraea insulae TaxID=1616787 RepID=A0ABW1CKP2_9ACTN